MQTDTKYANPIVVTDLIGKQYPIRANTSYVYWYFIHSYLVTFGSSTLGFGLERDSLKEFSDEEVPLSFDWELLKFSAFWFKDDLVRFCRDNGHRNHHLVDRLDRTRYPESVEDIRKILEVVQEVPDLSLVTDLEERMKSGSTLGPTSATHAQQERIVVFARGAEAGLNAAILGEYTQVGSILAHLHWKFGRSARKTAKALIALTRKYT